MFKKLVGILVVALIIIGGVWWLNMEEEKDSDSKDDSASSQSDKSSAETKVSLTINESDADPSSNTASEDVQDVNALELGSFYFSPNVLTFAPGSTVTLDLNNVEGFHDFVIDEFDVKTDTIAAGETERVTFTIPDNASGEYTFYCSIGNHREQGMEGTIVVQ